MANKWDSANKNAGVTLSNGDLTMSFTGASKGAVQSVDVADSGKIYLEYLIEGTDTGSMAVGLCATSFPTTTTSDITNPGAFFHATLRVNPAGTMRAYWRTVSLQNLDTLLGPAADGDVVGIAFDLTTGEWWCALNDVWYGDPGAGTGEVHAETPSAVYAIADTAQLSGREITVRFQPGEWTYNAPTGFGAWPNPPPQATEGGGELVLDAEGTGWAAKQISAEGDLALDVDGTGWAAKQVNADSELTLDASGTLARALGVSGGLDLVLDVDGQVAVAGVFVGDLVLPGLQSTGSGLAGSIAHGDLQLPALQAVGYSPGQAAIELPALQIDAQGAMGGLITAALQLPALGITTSGNVTGLAEGALVLPTLTLVARGVAGSIGGGSLVLPFLRSNLFGYGGSLGSSSLVLPALALRSTGLVGNLGSAQLTLPMLRLLAELGLPALSEEYWLLNTEVLAHSKVTGWSFTSFGELNGRTYGGGASGLHVLEGADDDGTDIAARFEGKLTDFGSEYLKAAHNLYVGYDTDGALEVTVTVDGGTTYTYSVSRDLLSAGQRGARAPIGKGLRSRYWQFGLRNVEGADFSIDSYGVTLKNHKRKS